MLNIYVLVTESIVKDGKNMREVNISAFSNSQALEDSIHMWCNVFGMDFNSLTKHPDGTVEYQYFDEKMGVDFYLKAAKVILR